MYVTHAGKCILTPRHSTLTQPPSHPSSHTVLRLLRQPGLPQLCTHIHTLWLTHTFSSEGLCSCAKDPDPSQLRNRSIGWVPFTDTALSCPWAQQSFPKCLGLFTHLPMCLLPSGSWSFDTRGTVQPAWICPSCLHHGCNPALSLLLFSTSLLLLPSGSGQVLVQLSICLAASLVMDLPSFSSYLLSVVP